MKTVETTDTKVVIGEKIWTYFYPDLNIKIEVFEESKGIYRYKIGSEISKGCYATTKSASEAALKQLLLSVTSLSWLIQLRIKEGKS